MNQDKLARSTIDMIYFWGTQNMSEHRVISDYLYFSHLNLVEYRKGMQSELKKGIDELRLAENISTNITDEEIEKIALGLDVADQEIGSKWFAVDNASEDISFTYDFENLLYVSFIFLWYAFVERRLNDLLKILNPEKQPDINCKQGMIHKTYEYLDEELDYQIDKSLWDELNLIRLLRNKLIHIGTDLPVDESQEEQVLYSGYDTFLMVRPELLEYIKSKGIYRGRGAVSLNRDYCFYLVHLSEKLFKKICGDLCKRGK